MNETLYKNNTGYAQHCPLKQRIQVNDKILEKVLNNVKFLGKRLSRDNLQVSHIDELRQSLNISGFQVNHNCKTDIFSREFIETLLTNKVVPTKVNT